ncbi:MAG: TldD/PmbA family protein [Bacteroidales bacterium]|nr:TldD/PmbA family protein [Bacteroidales bacterium]
MITEQEQTWVLEALALASREGADKARASLCKSEEDLVATLNGEVDKVTRCEDRSLTLSLFVHGRYGSFSTNKCTPDALRDFIPKAVHTTALLAPDACRDLPERSRICRTAITGDELSCRDGSIAHLTAEDRVRLALDAAVFPARDFQGAHPVSEEGEFSCSSYDSFLADSEGLRCRHRETSFDYGVEATVEDDAGNKYSDYWWTASTFLRELDTSRTGRTALERAAAQIGAAPAPNGSYTMVVDSEAAGKLVSPLLRALNGYALQQGNSFLRDSLGQQLFSEGLTLLDKPHIPGDSNSKLFDSEGAATQEGPIIENGIIRKYFINSYMAAKMKTRATQDDAVRPLLSGWPEPGLDRAAILQRCGRGILVTGFNGGNSNSATGDFSYGITGFRFENGRIGRPVSGMLVTGNFLRLWKNLLAAGDDARPCQSKLIPTLAFSNVDFNG